jgi:hypothetical protein
MVVLGMEITSFAKRLTMLPLYADCVRIVPQD